MAKKETPDVKVEDGNAKPADVIKVDGDATIEATGDLTVITPRNGDPAGAKADMDVPFPAELEKVVEENAPKTKTVRTGKNVITGKPVMKEVPVTVEKDYSQGRKLFPVHTTVAGSYNGRKIGLVAGQEVYLNEDELSVFRNYVHGAGK